MSEIALTLSVLVPATTRLAVISPHLDDGVLGCGDLLSHHSGSVVVTAFAGRPAAYPALTSWDERAGFASGDDVVAARRAEDEAALTSLDARPEWLDFPDPQYGLKPSCSALVDALTVALDAIEPDVVALPLGIFHDDHTLTSDAARAVLARRPSWGRLVYADAVYRAVPDLVEGRALTLWEAGMVLRPLNGACEPASDRKRRAVARYASQVRALERSWDGGVSDAFEPERYWQIVPSGGSPGHA